MMQNTSRESPGQPAARGDVIAAALLAAGALFERARGDGRAHRAWITAVPIVIVNYVAFRAQLRFWQSHLDRPDALLLSVALESIAIYWSYQAHQAVMADDSAIRLKLAAYGMALLIGVLNYSHYMKPGWNPTVAAVTFGMMSVISPWLWSANSRRSSRDVLKARGLIEDHAVRLGLTRWFWHAYRCVQVMHEATWTGENRPAEAIRLWQPRRDRKPASQPVPAEPVSQPARPVSQPARPAPVEPASGLIPAGMPEPPPPVPVREPRSSGARAARTGLAAALNDSERKLIMELVAGGPELPSQRTLAAARLDGSRAAAARVLGAARAEMNGGRGVRVNGS